MSVQEQLEQVFTITDLETLKVIADPLRLQILKAFKHPGTVKEIAAELDLPSTKLYYHVNQLEKHGLIKIVATNIVSGIIEKQYQVVARSYRVDDELFSDDTQLTGEGVENLVAAILDDTRIEIIKSIRAGLTRLSDKSPRLGRFARGNLHLSEEQAIELGEQLEGLYKKYEALSEANASDPGVKPYGFLLTVYPSSRVEEKRTTGQQNETATDGSK